MAETITIAKSVIYIAKYVHQFVFQCLWISYTHEIDHKFKNVHVLKKTRFSFCLQFKKCSYFSKFGHKFKTCMCFKKTQVFIFWRNFRKCPCFQNLFTSWKNVYVFKNMFMFTYIFGSFKKYSKFLKMLPFLKKNIPIQKMSASSKICSHFT